MMEAFWSFNDQDHLAVHIHPETIAAIENTNGMKANIENWKNGIGKHLVSSTDVPRGKARYIYSLEIDTGVDG
jgi:hypothetical protein